MSEYFSLSECDVIGFDLDHTLCRYNLKETSRLIYESFAQYLVEHKGYDKDLLHLTPSTWDFRGVLEGNLVKLAEDGTVLRATHGSKNLSTDDIIKHYGPKREWKHFNSLNTSYTRSAKYYFYDNYFDLPGALLCARVVDMLNKRGAEITSDVWKDIVAAIDHNYNTSAFRVCRNNPLITLILSLIAIFLADSDLFVFWEAMCVSYLQVVYFGDSMHSDMFPASSFGKWETVMIVEEMEGEGVPRANATPSNSPTSRVKGMKSPSALSNQWGSYFVDVQKNEGEETRRLTWCCQSIHTYSTMAIPNLSLDFKFQRFSPDKPITTGYYPRPPDSLLKWEEN
uniref:5'-nucleotidase domain containing 1 n=1 Tax=Cyprinus carpio TaxID=7962 RepID=A0A8C1MC27_CYPCA